MRSSRGIVAAETGVAGGRGSVTVACDTSRVDRVGGIVAAIRTRTVHRALAQGGQTAGTSRTARVIRPARRPLPRRRGRRALRLAPAIPHEQVHKQHEQHGHGDDGREQQRVEARGLVGDGDVLLDRRVHAMAAHEQTVRVDAVGRAGKQGAQVLALNYLQGRHVLRLHDKNLVHLVGERTREHRDSEGVAHLHLVEVGEEPRGGKPPVCGEHSVGGGPAHRQAAPLKVAHARSQGGVGRAVVDRQPHIEPVDGDVTHHVGAG